MWAEKKAWYPDYFRTTDDKQFVLNHFLKDFFFHHRLRYMVYFRNSQKCKTRLGKLAYELLIFHLCRKYGIEIMTETKIGKGFCLLHPYNITVSPYAVIGDNVTMLKGSTVGLGKRVDGRSAPVIGNHVYIGLNSTIVGGGNNW